MLWQAKVDAGQKSEAEVGSQRQRSDGAQSQANNVMNGINRATSQPIHIMSPAVKNLVLARSART
jgi:hypothetical protein